MSDKEMNMAILNKLYEIADKVFDEGVNVKEGNYTASDLAKKRHQPQRLWLSLSVFLHAWIFHRTICGWILQQISR